MSKRKIFHPPTQSEIDAILFGSDESDSDLESEDDGWPKIINGNCSFINDPGYNEEIFDQILEEKGNDFFTPDGNSDDAVMQQCADKENEIESTSNSFIANEVTFNWSEVVNDGLIPHKTKKFSGGSNHNLPVGSTEENYLKLLFTEEMCEQIRINTNHYAEFSKEILRDTYEPVGKKKWKWTPINDIQELWNFFSIILTMGISKLPRMKYYWCSNSILGNGKLKEIMTRDRFFQIYRYLHLSDRSTELPLNHENIT